MKSEIYSQGDAYALFSSGLGLQGKRAAVGTANAVMITYLGFFFLPPLLPPALLPATPNRVVIYNQEG
jgi:hypothetical protein